MLTFNGQIEPLQREHNRRQFNCGDAVLNDYLQRYARQPLKIMETER